MDKVRRLANNEFQETLQRIKNVADAEVFGGFQPEIRVSMDRDRMARCGPVHGYGTGRHRFKQKPAG